jgi:uroporphyrinogen decarboxylase
MFSISFVARNVGFSKSSSYEDPEKSFRAQTWSNEMYGAIPFTYYMGGGFGAREFGGEVKMPEGEYAMGPSLLRPPVESEEDIPELELPDVKTAGAMPLFMKFSKLQEDHGHYISILVGGTLTRVGFMCGVERMCRWMIKKPALMHRLCRLATDFIIEILKYWVGTFSPERMLPFNSSPTESNQIISPDLFEEFALPYQREVYEKGQALGIKHFFTHICGDQNLNLPYWAKFSHGDPGIISIGHEIDIETAASHFPNDIILGNVDTSILQYGTPDEIYEQAKACIEKGKRCPGGFILAPGCDPPTEAPPYNIWVLRKAVSEVGWYE